MPKNANGIIEAGISPLLRAHILTHRMRQVRVMAGLYLNLNFLSVLRLVEFTILICT